MTKNGRQQILEAVIRVMSEVGITQPRKETMMNASYLAAYQEESAEPVMIMRRVLAKGQPIYRGKLDEHTFDCFVIGGVEQHADALIGATHNGASTWWGPIQEFSDFVEGKFGQHVVIIWE